MYAACMQHVCSMYAACMREDGTLQRRGLAGCRRRLAGCRCGLAGCRCGLAGCRCGLAGCRCGLAGCRLAGCRCGRDSNASALRGMRLFLLVDDCFHEYVEIVGVLGFNAERVRATHITRVSSHGLTSLRVFPGRQGPPPWRGGRRVWTRRQRQRLHNRF
jgi:hypothetical protein